MIIKNCDTCTDILCKENKRKLCKDHDTGKWHWSFWQTMIIDKKNVDFYNMESVKKSDREKLNQIYFEKGYNRAVDEIFSDFFEIDFGDNIRLHLKGKSIYQFQELAKKYGYKGDKE